MHDIELPAEPSEPARLAYPINDFAAATGIGRTKIYAEIRAGRLTAVKVGARTLIPHAAGQAWLKALPKVGA